MHHHYDDIRSRIAEAPRWFDEHAVPRYCEFSPKACANIYAEEVMLLLIACQSCGRRFEVCMSTGMRRTNPANAVWSIARSGTIHYGDPPNVRCCPAGPTMNSEPIAVLQFWQRGGGTAFEWRRVAELERTLPAAEAPP